MSHTAKVSIRPLAVTLGLLATGATVHAHHSFAAVYDQTQPVRVEGTVVQIDWRNPHVLFYVAPLGRDTASTWTFEMGAPMVLTRRLGWSADTIRVGDHIVVDGFMARKGDRQAAAQFVTTAAGKRLSAVLPFR